MLAAEGQEPFLDRVLEILSPAFDGVEVLSDGGEGISDFAAARNKLVAAAERQRFDWMFMLDADECVFPADVVRLRSFIERTGVDEIWLPRVEVVMDRRHYVPRYYPDLQHRLFRLNSGYRYQGRLHERLVRRNPGPLPVARPRVQVLRSVPIFHYGMTKDPEAIARKWTNYASIAGNDPASHGLVAGGDAPTAVAHWCQDAKPLDIPEPLSDPSLGTLATAWSRYFPIASSVAEEMSILSTHSTLLTRLDDFGTLLDVGFGTGCIARYLASRGHTVTAVESDPVLVARAAGGAGCSVRVRFVQGDARSLNTDTNRARYGAAYSEGLLNHFDDEGVIEAVRSQLDVAQVAFASVPAEPDPADWPGDFGDEIYRSEADWRRLLSGVADVRSVRYMSSILPLRQTLKVKLSEKLHLRAPFVRNRRYLLLELNRPGVRDH